MQPAYLDELERTVKSLRARSCLAQAEIGHLAAIWRGRLLPRAAEEELFDVCDAVGRVTGVTAPRWLCHLLGLRHRATHIILRSPQGLLVLQVRSPAKADWPNHIDTSVGGHVRAGETYLEASLAEMEQELGLSPERLEACLVDGALEQVGEPYAGTDYVPGTPPMRNAQFNQIFAGQLTPDGLAQIQFRDGEVSALYLCNAAEAQRIVHDGQRAAPGLVHVLPRYQRWYRTRNGICR